MADHRFAHIQRSSAADPADTVYRTVPIEASPAAAVDLHQQPNGDWTIDWPGDKADSFKGNRGEHFPTLEQAYIRLVAIHKHGHPIPSKELSYDHRFYRTEEDDLHHGGDHACPFAHYGEGVIQALPTGSDLVAGFVFATEAKARERAVLQIQAAIDQVRGRQEEAESRLQGTLAALARLTEMRDKLLQGEDL